MRGTESGQRHQVNGLTQSSLRAAYLAQMLRRDSCTLDDFKNSRPEFLPEEYFSGQLAKLPRWLAGVSADLS